MSAKREQMLKMIGTIESENNYNIMTGGKRVALTTMTVGEVLEMQAKMKGNTAAGKYQIKESSLRSLVYKPGKDEGTYSDKLRNPTDFNLDTPFDEAAQDWAASTLLDRRGFAEFEAGNLSDRELAENLSKEWASLPSPGKGSNVSYYGGDGMHDNPTRVSVDDVYGVLNIMEGRSGGLRPQLDPVAGEGVKRPSPLQGNSSGTPMRQDALRGSDINTSRLER
jgi:muramidase (phage lysozyme)